MEAKSSRPIPARAIHPGEILREELTERGIKQKDFAKTIGMSPSHLNEFIKGKRNLNEDLAIKLETHLGIPYSFWIHMQAGYEYDLKAIAKKKDEEQSAIEFERKCGEILNIKDIYRCLNIADMSCVERVKRVKSVFRQLAFL